jgi:hypothetical protein
MTIMDPRNRDPLAITVGVISIMSNLAVWIWWGGHIDARVDGAEKRVAALEVAASLANQTSANQAQNIAVLTVKLDDIKASLDTVNNKLDRDRR